MASYTLFPSITPDEGDHIPRYREMDWDQLRVFTSSLEDVNAKQKREAIEDELDERYECHTLTVYAEKAWGMDVEEYKEVHG